MPWVRLDDQFDDDKDIDSMSCEAIALYVCATTWSARNLTDGHVPEARVKKLPGGSSDQAVAELCAGEFPWWVKVDGGYQIRSFLKYNPSGQEFKERREEISKVRAEAGRKGMETRWGKAKDKQTDSKDDSKTEDLLITNDSKIITPNPESRIPIPEDPNPETRTAVNAGAWWLDHSDPLVVFMAESISLVPKYAGCSLVPTRERCEELVGRLRNEAPTEDSVHDFITNWRDFHTEDKKGRYGRSDPIGSMRNAIDSRRPVWQAAKRRAPTNGKARSGITQEVMDEAQRLVEKGGIHAS